MDPNCENPPAPGTLTGPNSSSRVGLLPPSSMGPCAVDRDAVRAVPLREEPEADLEQTGADQIDRSAAAEVTEAADPIECMETVDRDASATGGSGDSRNCSVGAVVVPTW